MSRNQTLYFYVEVEFLSGKRRVLQLPNDLQEAMRTYYETYPDTWKEVLTGALINAPFAPYTKANNFQPMIRLTRVKRVFYMRHQQKRRSRGQFLTKENWTQKGW